MKPLRLELLAKTLRDHRGALLGWGLGLAVLAFTIMASYPAVANDPALDAYWQEQPESVRALFGDAASITSLDGFLESQILAYLPLLLAVHAIGKGARAIAGEEEDRTMDLLLAQPVPRVRVLLEKAGAIAVGLVAIAAATGLGLVGGALVAGVDAPLPRLVLACLNAVPPAFLLGSLALLGSATFRRRRHAILLATVVAVGGYFVNGMAALVDALAPLRWLSPFHYYAEADVLAGTVAWWAPVALLAATTALVAGAAYAFERKDLTG